MAYLFYIIYVFRDFQSCCLHKRFENLQVSLRLVEAEETLWDSHRIHTQDSGLNIQEVKK